MVATFTIKKTEDEDGGTYTVTAKNETGEASADLTLVVLSKAGPPRNLTVSDVTPKTATLNWEAPLNDGGAPIKHYLVEKRSATRTTWTKVTTVQETTTAVTDLVHGHKFEFRVKAITDQGEGAEAQVGPIVADYTFGNTQINTH